jgi:glycosyltransferase involved in cell wall biosynthesis
MENAMHRTRVLILNHTAVMGGAEVGLAEWLPFLDADRIDPMVVLPNDGPLHDRLLDGGQSVITQRLRRFVRPRSPVALIRMTVQAMRAVAGLHRLTLNRQAQVLHANSLSAGLVGLPAARLAGCPAIWHVRDLVPLGRLGRWMYRQAAAIVAISPAVADYVQQYQRGPDRVHLIPNGIDTQRFIAPTAGTLAINDWFPDVPETCLLVGMVGNLTPWKRHDLFLEVADRLLRQSPDQFRFVIAGDDRFDDHADYVASLRRRTAAPPLAGRVHWAGYCEDMPGIMQAMDILLHPASREPFGRVVVEAMAAGNPVVAVRDGGPADSVVHGQTGWLTPPGDIAAMTAAIHALATDRAMRLRMGEAGRRRAVAEFDVRRVGRQLTDLYYNVGRGTP